MLLIVQNFMRDMKIGKLAEERYLLFLKRNRRNARLTPPGTKAYDIIDETNPQEPITYEVKFDTWIKKTGNVCIELWSHFELKNPGWSQYTEADYLIYFMSDSEYLKIPMNDIKAFVNNPQEMQKCKIVSAPFNGNRNVVNVLVPYKKFTNEIFTLDFINNEDDP